MKSSFRSSFQRDLKRIRDERVLTGVRQAIINVEEADDWTKVSDIKKIQGTANAFRIRVGDYRIGLDIENGTAEFVRVLPRRDVYRQFP